MICYDDIWSKNFRKSCFFKIVWACWGCVWVSSLVILRPSKNLKKFENFTFFSKVVYRPLGYYLASSLIIFSPEINIFEKSKKYFSKHIFSHIIFYFLVYLRINSPKN